MGADSTYLFYGVRYQVSDESEISQLGTGTHPLLKAAKKARLQTVWGNFDVDGGEYYLLYVGRQLAALGHEGVSDIEISDIDLARVQLDVRRKLSVAGFSLTPARFAQFEADV
ncbi:MAG TPA: hypothetical protein PLN05_13485 [Pyrinomonadaceae bacterium]|nr:hypothetical protein [Chloracidobacterium sp.]HBE83908.1 hypothetical protein [Blastocatellia bacterium]HRJ88946.1 hypothetical protein [Pyrinomonadaceae bacterium]HRK51436.1 hypothetical protein [Pyrinomonadaceae bacterium]